MPNKKNPNSIDLSTQKALIWIQKLLEIYNGLPSPVKSVIKEIGKEVTKEIIKKYVGGFKQEKHPIKITDATKLIPDAELKIIVEIMTNDDFEEYPLEFKEYIFLEDRLRKKVSE